MCSALLCFALPVLVLPRSPPGQCKTTAGAKTPPDGRGSSKGAYSVCESRLFPQRRFILPGSLSPRLRLRLRLRLPGVSPLTARARLPRDYDCWLAVGTKAKRPIYRSWVGSIFAGVLCVGRCCLLTWDSSPSIYTLCATPLLLLSVDTYILAYITIISLLDRPPSCLRSPTETLWSTSS